MVAQNIWMEEKFHINVRFIPNSELYIVVYNQEELVLPYIFVQNFHHYKRCIFQNIQDSEKLGAEKHQIRKTSSCGKLIFKTTGHTGCPLKTDNCNIS